MTVGGSVTAATEVKLFGIIGSKISVSVEAEHEWTETNSFTRSAKVYLAPQQTGLISDGARDRCRQGDPGAHVRVVDVHRHELLDRRAAG